MGGTPIAGWFMRENTMYKWMITRGTPISGNHIVVGVKNSSHQSSKLLTEAHLRLPLSCSCDDQGWACGLLYGKSFSEWNIVKPARIGEANHAIWLNILKYGKSPIASWFGESPSESAGNHLIAIKEESEADWFDHHNMGITTATLPSAPRLRCHKLCADRGCSWIGLGTACGKRTVAARSPNKETKQDIDTLKLGGDCLTIPWFTGTFSTLWKMQENWRSEAMFLKMLVPQDPKSFPNYKWWLSRMITWRSPVTLETPIVDTYSHSIRPIHIHSCNISMAFQ